MTRMPFGKHRGMLIEDLPLEYLEWLVDQDFVREPLNSKLRAEYERRAYSQENHRGACINPSIVDELVAAGLRSLALKYHPDRGGDHNQMVAVNQAADWLRQQARAIS
jgi:hypothetical protein